jgi:toxin ParE1/3/4
MPYRVEIGARATRDLNDIYLFIDADRSDTAARWFNRLHDALRSLAEMPQRCPFVPESGSLRHLLYGTKPHIYRVIFSIDEPVKGSSSTRFATEPARPCESKPSRNRPKCLTRLL